MDLAPPADDDAPFVLLQLRRGWRLDAGGLRHRQRRQPLPPDWLLATLQGARLRPALPLAAVRRVGRTPAERELARWVHLLPPAGAAPGDWLVRARAWPFVESARLPPMLPLS